MLAIDDAVLDCIAAVIDLLDLLDGDCDLEIDHDRCDAHEDVGAMPLGQQFDMSFAHMREVALGGNEDDGEPDQEEGCIAGEDLGTNRPDHYSRPFHRYGGFYLGDLHRAGKRIYKIYDIGGRS